MNNKVQNIVLGVLAVALIGITVAYATLTQQLKINGTATVKAGSHHRRFCASSQIFTKQGTQRFNLIL